MASGITHNTTYTWYVNASDGSDWNNETFWFKTELAPNNSPTHDNPVLISEFGANTTDENLICYNQSTMDLDKDEVFNTYHWYKDGMPLTNLLMPFNSRNSTGVKDYSGYDNNGNLHGATWTSNGKIGGAYSFNGINDYIAISDNSTLDGDGNWDEMTIELWIKPDSVIDSSIILLDKRGSNTSLRSYQIGATSAGKLWCAFYVAPDGYYSTSTSISSRVLNPNTWYHIVGTYKDGVGIKLFFNASIEAINIEATGPIRESDGVPINIGRRGTGDRYFDGVIDEVKIYSFALSEEQIIQNYLNSKDGFSSNSIIVSEETNMGDVWQCEVTPSDLKSDGITKQSNQLAINDTSSPEIYNISLNVSWNLISLPFNESINKTDIVVSYGGSNYSWQEAIDNNIILGFVYGWDEINQGYDFTDILMPGKGYWMYAYDSCDLMIVSTTNNDGFITDLSTAWNLIGVPYNASIEKENITVFHNEIENTWQQAVDNNILLGFVYEWDEIDQGYDFTDVLDPTKGCWMYAYQNCTLYRSAT